MSETNIPPRIDQSEFGSFGNCNSACIAMVLNLPIEQVPNWTKVEGSDNDRFEAMRAWLRERGWGIITIERGGTQEWPPNPGVYIVGGPSVRGLEHAVVYRDGELWHDPHPDRTGVEFVRTVDLLYPFVPAEVGDLRSSISALRGAVRMYFLAVARMPMQGGSTHELGEASDYLRFLVGLPPEVSSFQIEPNSTLDDLREALEAQG